MPLTMYRAAGWRERPLHVLEEDYAGTEATILAQRAAGSAPSAIEIAASRMLGRGVLDSNVRAFTAANVRSLLNILGGISTADQSLSTNTMTDLTNLSFLASIDKKYLILGQITVSCANATPDYRIALTFPSGDMLAGVSSNPDSGSSDGDYIDTSGSQTNKFNIPAGGQAVTQIIGSFIATASGTVQARFKQNTTNANAITAIKGSFLFAMEIS